MHPPPPTVEAVGEDGRHSYEAQLCWSSRLEVEAVVPLAPPPSQDSLPAAMGEPQRVGMVAQPVLVPREPVILVRALVRLSQQAVQVVRQPRTEVRPVRVELVDTGMTEQVTENVLLEQTVGRLARMVATTEQVDLAEQVTLVDQVAVALRILLRPTQFLVALVVAEVATSPRELRRTVSRVIEVTETQAGLNPRVTG